MSQLLRALIKNNLILFVKIQLRFQDFELFYKIDVLEKHLSMRKTLQNRRSFCQFKLHNYTT